METQPYSNDDNTIDLEQLHRKERAITAGLVVQLEPHEADALGVIAFDEVPDDPEALQDLLDSRFDPCEFDLDNYSLEQEQEE